MVPFITAAQFFTRVDSRWVSMNLMDDGTRPTVAQMSNTATDAGARLYQLMQDASEELMSAALVGARYTETEIRTYGGSLVVSIVCGLTLGPVLERRVRAATDRERFAGMYARAAGRVEELRKGERIFWAVPNVPEAGLPEVADSTPIVGLEPPSTTQESGRYFGTLGGPDECYPGGNPYYPNPGPYPGA